jgi:hypothetical protein
MGEGGEEVEAKKYRMTRRRRSATRRVTAPQKTLTHWCNKEQSGIGVG